MHCMQRDEHLDDELQSSRHCHEPGWDQREHCSRRCRHCRGIHEVHAEHAQCQPGEAGMEERQLHKPSKQSVLKLSNVQRKP